MKSDEFKPGFRSFDDQYLGLSDHLVAVSFGLLVWLLFDSVVFRKKLHQRV